MIVTDRLARVQSRYIPSIIAKAKSDQQTEIERMAEKVAPGLGKAIAKLLAAQQDSIDLNALAAALQAGNVDAVLAMLAGADLGAATAEIQAAVQASVWGAGAATAATINAQISGASYIFGQLNPRLVTWLQTYSLGLIRQINQSTREAIRDTLIDGMKAGDNPIRTARTIKQVIGLTSRQQKAVLNFKRHLETFHLKQTAGAWNLGAKIDRVNGRQVMKPDAEGLPKDGINARRLRDFRFDGQLKRAMETGKPLTAAQIDKMVAAYSRKYLRHRSETIARTEALRTTNFGVQDAWRQAIEQGKAAEPLVRRRWVVAADERLCPTCQPIPGMNPKRGVKFDQPFATPVGPTMLPPIHPNCRCTVFIRAFEPEQLES